MRGQTLSNSFKVVGIVSFGAIASSAFRRRELMLGGGSNGGVSAVR